MSRGATVREPSHDWWWKNLLQSLLNRAVPIPDKKVVEQFHVCLNLRRTERDVKTDTMTRGIVVLLSKRDTLHPPSQ
jgi:hypothetical protein